MSGAATILTAAQQEVLRSLAGEADLADEFVLSGGTALAAFYLHHRCSDDLDFFSVRPVDALRVRRFVDGLRQRISAGSVDASRLYDRHLFVLDVGGSPLKIEFTQYPYQSLEEPTLHDGVRVESLRDIGADKLATLLDRFEPKDYYDLYFLLRPPATLSRLRADVEWKFGIKAGPVQLGAAFARAQALPILPHLLLPVTSQELGQFFDDLASGLRSEVIE